MFVSAVKFGSCPVIYFIPVKDKHANQLDKIS